MTKWINIMSVSNSVSVEQLRAIAKEAGPVPIGPEEGMGKTIRYEVRDDLDLYAEVEVVAAMHKYDRACAICNGETMQLLAVLFTRLPRDLIRGLSIGQWE